MNENIEQLERQAERATQYTLAALDKINRRVTMLEELLGDTLEGLISTGVLAQEAFADFEPPRQEEGAETNGDFRDIPWPGVALRIEDENDPPLGPPVDCEARLHICKAACCRLGFPLSPQEVEGGVVKWDLGHPYLIRHEADGYCTHIARDDLGCRIYAERPAVCQRYSCVHDTRIWKDFDNMVLNDEWIAENMARSGRIHFVRRPRMEDVPKP